MKPRRGIVAIAMVVGAAACSNGEKPAGALPQITSTPTVTPSSTASIPPFPATKQGAADFVRHYLQVGNAVEATGRVESLEPLFQSTCTTCLSFVATMRKYYSDGHVSGGQVIVRFVETALADNSTATVTATVSTAGGQVYDRAGNVVKTIPPVRGGTLLFRLVRVDPGWQVASYGISS